MDDTYGATCVPSPSNETNARRAILAKKRRASGQFGNRDLRGVALHDLAILALPGPGLTAHNEAYVAP